MSTGQGQTGQTGQDEAQGAQVSTDDLAGLSPETIQNIVNTRLGGTLSAPSSASTSPPAGQEGASTDSGATSSPTTPSSPSLASQAPELRQSDEFTAQGELDGDEEGEEELDGEGDDGDGAGGDSEPFTPPNLSDEEEYVQLGEQRIPRRVVEAYQRFDEAFQSDPGLRALVSAYLQSGTVPAQLVQPSPQSSQSAQQQPPQQLQQPPVDLDLDDPATRTLWEAHVATQQRLDAITAHLQTQQQQTQAEQMGRSQALVNRAVKSFQTQHNLTDEETQRLCGMVQRSNLIESFMRTPDPINGTPQRPDPLRAVEQSLDVMFHYAPEFRNRTVAVAEHQRRETSRKKAKLSSLSPRSGGSQSRKTPAPTDEAGRRAAMVAEVGEMMAGTWTG